MGVTVMGLVFDSQSEANRYERSAKSELYKSGWVYTGPRRGWFLKETRRIGKILLVEIPNWKEAYEWEMQMRAIAAVEGAGK